MKQQIKFAIGVLGLVVAATWLARSVGAQEAEWPLELESDGTHIVLYQPQPESFQNDKVTARAAVSVERQGETEPVFGAVWLEARVSTDRDARTVSVLEVKVPKVKFASAAPGLETTTVNVLQGELTRRHCTFSLDRLLSTLEQGTDPASGAANLQSDPPHILLVKEPTALVMIDGAPKLQTVAGSSVMRVVNTPFVILFQPAQKTYYLLAGERWTKAERLEGPWQDEARPPAEVAAAVPPRSSDSTAAAQVPQKSGAERILVATEPTELLVCDGEPKWTPLQGNELLYLSNSENDVFMELGSQKLFVLLAGRWYTGPSLEKGPWTFVPADKLPPAFAHIPPASAKGDVRTFIAGTDEARDGLLDAAIPQTSAVKRSEAHCEVSYDGEPRFEAIPGTKLSYAVNTSSSVIESEGKYYCCNEAVWFTASSPQGPWTVCTEVPQEIYSVPPSCPVYPVKYVHVYDSTPEIVYVGYLPGYVGCYSYGPTIVYGTGYWYPGWYGTVYYPRPHTWCFAPHYNPWSCDWSFGFGFGWGVSPGWFSFNVGWGHPGWWGPGGFGGSHFDIHGRVVHVHSNPPPSQGGRLVQAIAGHANIYTRPENAHRNLFVAGAGANAAPGLAIGRAHANAPPSNDLYVDREGRVLRRTNEGWQERRADGWKPAERAAPVERPGEPNLGPVRPVPGSAPRNPPVENPPRPNPPPVRPPQPPPGDGQRPVRPPGDGQRPVAPPPSRPPHEEFERMHEAREHGDARASAFQHSRGQGEARGNRPGG